MSLMEVDRKRASDGGAPEAKRPAIDLDGPVTAEDVDQFQKDAIFRQMNAYRRERDELQSQLEAAISGDEALRAELQKLTQQYIDVMRRAERGKSAASAKLLRTPLSTSDASDTADDAEKNGDSTPVKSEDIREPTDGSDNNLAQPSQETKQEIAALNAEVSQLKQAVESADAAQRVASSRVQELEIKLASLPATLTATEQRLVRAQDETQAAVAEVAVLTEQLSDLRASQPDFEVSARERVSASLASLERRLNAAEADVTRIRNNRDELLSEVSVLKADAATQRHEVERVKELLEVEQQEKKTLSKQSADDSVNGSADDESNLSGCDPQVLIERVQALSRQNRALSSEIGSMEEAFARASAKAKTAIKQATAAEQKLGVLNAAKVRSDEKYIGAMRAKDAESGELTKLKQALARSAEVLADQKAAEQRLAAQVTRHLKQLGQQEVAQQKTKAEADASRRAKLDAESRLTAAAASLTAVRDQLTKLEEQKHQAEVARRAAETRSEKLESQLATQRAVSGLGSSSDLQEQLESLRSIAMCPVCEKNWKDRALTTCGHTMCNDCVQARLTARMRKCPMCNGHFASNDVLPIHL